jgi:hypothetical protein
MVGLGEGEGYRALDEGWVGGGKLNVDERVRRDWRG